MIRTIRARIALWTVAVFGPLALLAAALVLAGLDRALARLADEDLREELEELASEAADASLARLLERGGRASGEWNDLVFELRDGLEERRSESGARLLYEIRRGGTQVVAASPELSGAQLGRRGAVQQRGGISFREEADPRPGAAGARLRVAEIGLGPYQLALARSFQPFARIQEAARVQLLSALLAVAGLGAWGAYLIARRALSPVRRLSEEARRLHGLPEGTLPRTGRRDEIDDLAAVLNELLGRVRREVLRTRQFTADAAHEIRTPLAAIRGHLELLLPEASPPAQQALAGVLEEVERLGRIVNQLLLLEKLETGPQAAPRRRIDLAALVADLGGHLRILAAEQGIELGWHGGPAPVEGDPEQLRQVFLNLLDNAFRHTPRGGAVSVELARAGERVRAVVRDTGPGIAPDRLERIFERFASDRSQRGAGSGLGLPIARAIARAHGGELTAASRGGAEFTLELPAAPAEPAGLRDI
jgi:signal transduction histidine kinase